MAQQNQIQRVIKTLFREFSSLNLAQVTSEQAKIYFPDTDYPLNFQVILTPKEGYYKNGRFVFHLSLPLDYPNSKPTITCMTKIYHPNISYWGDICLNILSDDWTPKLRVVDYICGLLFLLLFPNLDDPLNRSVTSNPELFAQSVRDSLKGGFVSEEYFSENECDCEDDFYA